MRVNPKVFTERMDMLGGIQIPNCPSGNISKHSLRTVCENIVNMFCELDYVCSGYSNMTEADNMIALDYWRKYDNLKQNNEGEYLCGRDWFIHKATSWEAIRRSREWLIQHHYLIPNIEVGERAIEAGDKLRRSIKQ